MSCLARNYQFYALCAIITIGTLLRVFAGANSELRFDELISLELVSGIQSPGGILFTLHHDNNHPLASLFIFLIGAKKYTPGIWYRTIPILSSLLSLILLSRILLKRAENYLPAMLGTAIFSSSLLSITLSSEIRGYSFAASAALVAFFLHYSRKDIIGIVGFNLACCAGFLSHATFILFFVAMGIADLLMLIKIRVHRLRGTVTGDTCRNPPQKEEFLEILRWDGDTSFVDNQNNAFLFICGRYLFSSLFLIALYIVFYRNLPPVSAPLTPWRDTVASTLSLSIGGPWISMISRPIYVTVWLYAGAGSWLLIQSLLHTIQFRSHRLHLILIIIILPLLAVLLLSPQAIAERYLYLPVIFSFLLFAEFLAFLMSKGGWRRLLGITITTLILSGNVLHSGCFILYGKGRMHDLIKYCKENLDTPASPLIIAGDHYLRIGLPLKRIAEEYPDLKIRYSELVVDQDHEISAEWIISHYVDRAYSPPLKWQSPHGETFYLVKIFSNYSLNSWPLFLYRKSKTGN